MARWRSAVLSLLSIVLHASRMQIASKHVHFLDSVWIRAIVDRKSNLVLNASRYRIGIASKHVNFMEKSYFWACEFEHLPPWAVPKRKMAVNSFFVFMHFGTHFDCHFWNGFRYIFMKFMWLVLCFFTILKILKTRLPVLLGRWPYYNLGGLGTTFRGSTEGLVGFWWVRGPGWG